MRGYDYQDPKIKPVLEELRYWTNSYPLELDIWHRTKGLDLQEKFSSYMKRRKNEIETQHVMFRANLTREKKNNLNKCIVTMILEASKASNIKDGLDRQFMHDAEIPILNDQGNRIDMVKTYVAIHPIAKMAIRNSFDDKGFKIFIHDVASSIFMGNYTNNVKRRFVVLYITTLLESQKEFAFEIIKPGKKQVYKIKNKTLNVVEKFVGNNIPPNNFNLKLTTLFLPMSPNYSGADFLIWDSEGKILYAFQITISSPNDHMESKKKFMTGSLIGKWVSMCDIVRKDVKFVWIAPDSVLEN
ncbi:5290_t:CDS:2, partial [Racocetra fulgida]